MVLCTLVTGIAAAAPRPHLAPAESVNYVFASELGSGIYDLNGRSLQVYRLRPRHNWREATPGSPGLRFVVPVTVGFFDFSPLDIPGEGLPRRIDSLSIMPGIEVDVLLKDDWVMTPWVRAGVNLAEGASGALYSIGMGFGRERLWRGHVLRQRHELAVAGVAFRASLPGDRFVRLRQAAEMHYGSGLSWRGRELEYIPYALFDILIDPPAVPLTDGSKEPLRMELGMMLGTRPGLRLWRLPVPRLGLGYRFAGQLSGWHIAIGTQF